MLPISDNRGMHTHIEHEKENSVTEHRTKTLTGSHEKEGGMENIAY